MFLSKAGETPRLPQITQPVSITGFTGQSKDILPLFWGLAINGKLS